MAQGAKLTDDQIRKARQILARLPTKDGAKSPKDAAELLVQDFKKARKKGYGYQEISKVLKEEGITIPAYLVKKYLAAPEQEPDEPAGTTEDKTADNGEGKPDEKTAQESCHKADDLKEDTQDNVLAKKGKFVVYQDTPDGEL